MKKRVSFSALFLFSALLIPLTARSATLPVTSLADDGTVGTLRYVLKFANDGDVIEVPAGIIVLSSTGSTALDVDLVPDVDLDVLKSVTIQGAGAGETIIDANGPTTGARVFEIDPDETGVGAIIAGVTIQNGSPGADGGGIYVRGGSLQIYDSAVSGNDVDGSFNGGGIFVEDQASLVVGNCTISHNTAYYGGGVYFESYSTGTIKDSTISENTVDDGAGTGYGGGVYVYYSAVDLINTKVNDNEASPDSAGSSYGGGIYNDNGSLRLIGTGSPTGCEVSGNSTADYGGGIYNDDTILIDNCLIANNTVTETGGYGAGIYNAYELDIRNSTVDGNHSAGYGGGIYTDDGITIVGSTISNNIADNGYGGGIYNDGYYMSIDSSVVTGNVSKEGYGGGIYAYGYNVIRKTVITNNEAQNYYDAGGGIYVENGGSTIIDGCTIAGNRATGDDGSDDSSGGGIFHYAYALTIVNTTIANNAADGHGGGIYVENNDDNPVNLNNVTITGNVADANEGGLTNGDGGGIYNNDVIGFSNTIIAGNTDASPGAESPDCFNDFSNDDDHVMNSVGPNFVGDDFGCEIHGNTEPATFLSGDPLFEAAGLADNSGLSVGDPDSPVVLQTIALQSGSPAIDAGEDRSSEVTDERGVTRPVDGNGDGEAKSDLGAFEADAAAGGTTGGTTGGETGGETTGGTTGGTSDSGGCSLIR